MVLRYGDYENRNNKGGNSKRLPEYGYYLLFKNVFLKL